MNTHSEEMLRRGARYAKPEMRFRAEPQRTFLCRPASFTDQLATRFKGSETWLGVFYPRKYIIATFSSFDTAMSGKQARRAAGLRPDEFRAVSGGEMLHFFHEMQARNGLLGDLMTEFSRFIGTEAGFFDRDVWQARRRVPGCALLDSEKRQITFASGSRHRTPWPCKASFERGITNWPLFRAVLPDLHRNSATRLDKLQLVPARLQSRRGCLGSRLEGPPQKGLDTGWDWK